MDILLHTFSGVAIASVVANIAPISAAKKAQLFFFGALGGALPDFDAISLWSKFDQTIGAFFHLEHSGRDIYFNTFPYSHHGAMHSLLFPLLLILSVQLIRFGIQQVRKGKKQSFINRLKSRKWPIVTFFMAYLFHIVEDMPTPGAAWGGVNLLWPTDIWIGGTGDIWWWNNYDLFLIVNSIIVINVLVLIIPALNAVPKKRIAVGVFSFGLLLGIYQIKTRGFDFDYQGFAPDYKTSEARSKEIQREILGETVYNWMEALDNKIPLNF